MKDKTPVYFNENGKIMPTESELIIISLDENKNVIGKLNPDITEEQAFALLGEWDELSHVLVEHLKNEHLQDEHLKELDEKIKELCVFINNLDGIRTIGCCQGHDDGGKTGNFDEPYLTFITTNQRNLGLLSSLMYAYQDTDDWSKEDKKILPKLKAYWNIIVLPGEDSECSPKELLEDGRSTDEYVLYCLSPHPDSYEKPSDIYSDFDKILKYYKIKKQLVYKDV